MRNHQFPLPSIVSFVVLGSTGFTGWELCRSAVGQCAGGTAEVVLSNRFAGAPPGTSGLPGPVIAGQPIQFSVRLQQNDPAGCYFVGGQLSVTLPNAVTPPIPPLGQYVRVAGFGRMTPSWPEIPQVDFGNYFPNLNHPPLDVPLTYIAKPNDAVLLNGQLRLVARADYGSTEVYPDQTSGIFHMEFSQLSSANSAAGMSFELAQPEIQLAISSDPISLCAGSSTPVTYTYAVSIPPLAFTPGRPPRITGGNVPLTDIAVIDDHCGRVNFVPNPREPEFNVGDLNLNNKLDLDESWLFSCSTLLTEATTNTATAAGTFSNANAALPPPPAPNTVTVSAVTSYTVSATSCGCIADISPSSAGDGVVNVDDLLMVIYSWGDCPQPCRPHCRADIAPIGGDCAVNIDDLMVVILQWGACQ